MRGPVAKRKGYTAMESPSGRSPPVQRAATIGIMMYIGIKSEVT